MLNNTKEQFCYSNLTWDKTGLGIYYQHNLAFDILFSSQNRLKQSGIVACHFNIKAIDIAAEKKFKRNFLKGKISFFLHKT